MIHSLKIRSLILFLLITTTSTVFSQESPDIAKKIVGKWDVVLEIKSTKYSKEILTRAKEKAKRTSGNSNIAIYFFDQDGTFRLISISDYSQGDEEGNYELSDNKTEISRTITYPNHLKTKKRLKPVHVKTKILYIDDVFCVLQRKKTTSYMRRV